MTGSAKDVLPADITAEDLHRVFTKYVIRRPGSDRHAAIECHVCTYKIDPPKTLGSGSNETWVSIGDLLRACLATDHQCI